MNRTKVEWVKNPDGSQGYSWNPITGCLSNCEYCYARQLAHKRLKATYLANNILPLDNEPNHKEHLANPFYPRFWPDRLKELPRTKSRTFGEEKLSAVHHRDATPKGIFVCNMCEFFGDWVPANWQREIFDVIKANPQHRFYFLTKQPQNLFRFSPFPDNCWVGVTACDKQMTFFAGRYYFDIAQAKVRFVSFEPLLDNVIDGPFGFNLVRKADWIVIGSQTKPYNPPKIEWVQAIIEAADAAGKPVFLKDNLKSLMGNNLRQEFPVG